MKMTDTAKKNRHIAPVGNNESDSMEPQKVERIVLDDAILPELMKGFRFKKKVKFDFSKDGFYSKSGVHVGKSFIKKIAGNPKIEKRLVSDAWHRFGQVREILDRMERAIEDTNVSMKEISRLLVDYFRKSHSAALDFIFDAETYICVVRQNLKKGDDKRFDGDVINSITTSNGVDNISSFKKHVLLFLAYELGKTSSHQSTYSFRNYDWNWYRRNYIALKKRAAIFKVTEAHQSKELEKFKKMLGTKTFEDVLNAMRELDREIMIRRLTRQETVERLIKNAKQGKKETIKALTHLAGESCTLNEEMHITNFNALYRFVLAAEKRKIPIEHAVGLFIAAIFDK